MDNLQIATPEIFLLAATCAVLVVGLFVQAKSNTVYWLSQLTLVITLIMSLSQIGDDAVTGLSGAYTVDVLSASLKSWVLVIAIGIFLYSRDYVGNRKIARSEYFVLGLFAVAGMMIMVSATHMLSVYLGLELLALSQYAMVALHRDNGLASEAAMKYFVLGALASGMLLYGMSMIYGATGSLNLTVIGDVLAGNSETLSAERTIGARFGLTFLIVGLAFKLGAVPFHMWVPDVYEGAPTSVTMFISTAPKIAAFAMLVRLLVGGLETLSADWQQMLAILSALSMVVGNLIAIAQTNIKRMFAYSTISHVGFLLMGIVGATNEGYSASMFYAITYAFTTLAAFGVILAVSRAGFEADQLTDLSGLGKKNALLAGVMLLAMISLAGVPPAVGFYAKLSVLESAVGAGFTWLAILGVIMSVVGAFYYLRIIKIMFFDDPADDIEVNPAGDVTAGLAINGLAVIGLGLAPGLIMGACIAAFA
ncbi:NADH-quinone oxidoreductase subunit NuoN [Granulosicoccus antarcticus]|uniref:NADH-quinone oxidoreductase subunit N n=1 Tax=Granulosicoccus antarcticus IMCC3135 TaxID=1192854 RepID=A0A2Z2NX60_9GAMM|nr:NADH-quinone oxidoreductase subunit NuoN [Granulosicoccus antarcticus]ASJ72317.1 NADH-quinone oxidoreductase subunit N [Granulosicoccus antarcticus IMCC3135]